MTAHSDRAQSGKDVSEPEEELDDYEKEFFQENGGLGTRADLRMVSGTSPVTVKTGGLKDDLVVLEVGVSAGSVSVDLNPGRALQLAEALEDAALAIHNRGEDDE